MMARPLPREFGDLCEIGVNHVLSLLEADEAHALGLSAEARYCADAGLAFDHFPIADRGVPESPLAFAILTRRLHDNISAGDHLAIHCRAGIGRAGLTAAAILLSAGHDPDSAFVAIRDARGVPVPDTAAQAEWLREHAALISDRNIALSDWSTFGDTFDAI